MRERVGVVVNYFNPERRRALQYQTLLCVARYLDSKGVEPDVVLTDGSGEADAKLVGASREMGFRYVASGVPISFGEGYNQGMRQLSLNGPPEFVVLSANDLFVSPTTIERMRHVIATHPDAGCVIPYLTRSDYPPQNDRYYRRLRYCWGMTLNVNMFRFQELLEIGGVPEHLSGYFNDILIMDSLRRRKKRVLLCDASVITHLGAATISSYSLASRDKDAGVFRDRHPSLVPRNPVLLVRSSEFMEAGARASLLRSVEASQSRFLGTCVILGTRTALVAEKMARAGWDVLRRRLRREAVRL